MLPPTATCHTVDNGVMATPVVSRYAGAVAPASLIPSLCSFHPPRRSSLETTSSLGVVRNSVEGCVQFTSYLNSFSFYSLESRVSFHFFSLKSFGKTHSVRVCTLYLAYITKRERLKGEKERVKAYERKRQTTVGRATAVHRFVATTVLWTWHEKRTSTTNARIWPVLVRVRACARFSLGKVLFLPVFTRTLGS